MPRIDELTSIGELSTEAVFPVVQDGITYKASISQIEGGGEDPTYYNKEVKMNIQELLGAVTAGFVSTGDNSAVLVISIDPTSLDVEFPYPQKMRLQSLTLQIGAESSIFTREDLETVLSTFTGYQEISLETVNINGSVYTYGMQIMFDSTEAAAGFVSYMNMATITDVSMFCTNAEIITAHIVEGE